MTGARGEWSLDRSWVVEASAGTGKTTALINQMVAVIAAGTPVETIVAVTFTHSAAGNMKLRVRHELESRKASEPDPKVKARLAEAARSLDRAFIGTIHAFCAQLLRDMSSRGRRRPCVPGTGSARRIAGFPAGVSALDRASLDVAFERHGAGIRAFWRGARNAILQSR